MILRLVIKNMTYSIIETETYLSTQWYVSPVEYTTEEITLLEASLLYYVNLADPKIKETFQQWNPDHCSLIQRVKRKYT